MTMIKSNHSGIAFVSHTKERQFATLIILLIFHITFWGHVSNLSHFYELFDQINFYFHSTRVKGFKKISLIFSTTDP